MKFRSILLYNCTHIKLSKLFSSPKTTTPLRIKNCNLKKWRTSQHIYNYFENRAMWKHCMRFFNTTINITFIIFLTLHYVKKSRAMFPHHHVFKIIVHCSYNNCNYNLNNKNIILMWNFTTWNALQLSTFQ